MKWRPSSSVTLPASGFIEPCIPTATNKAPAGPDWLFELKMDGYRLLARKNGREVRIYSRRGADFTARFPRLVEAMKRLRATSAMLDGEGIVYDVVSFSTCEGWSWDVSYEFAAEIQRRADIEGLELSGTLADFVEFYTRPARRLAFRLV